MLRPRVSRAVWRSSAREWPPRDVENSMNRLQRCSITLWRGRSRRCDHAGTVAHARMTPARKATAVVLSQRLKNAAIRTCFLREYQGISGAPHLLGKRCQDMAPTGLPVIDERTPSALIMYCTVDSFSPLGGWWKESRLCRQQLRASAGPKRGRCRQTRHSPAG